MDSSVQTTKFNPTRVREVTVHPVDFVMFDRQAEEGTRSGVPVLSVPGTSAAGRTTRSCRRTGAAVSAAAAASGAAASGAASGAAARAASTAAAKRQSDRD